MSVPARPDLTELERLREEATSGRWSYEISGDAIYLDVGEIGEIGLRISGAGPEAVTRAALIVAAVNALPSLLAEAREVETLRVGLRRIAEFGEERSFSIPADQMACLARAALEGASLRMRHTRGTLAVRVDGETLLHEIIDYLRKVAAYERWCDMHGRAA